MRQLFLPYRYYILLPVKNKVKFEKEKWLDKIKSQTEEMMLKKEESLFNKFTSTQRDSLVTYSSSAYQQMNGYLRKKAAGLPSDISDNLLKDIKNCQKALSKVGFDEDLVLRRGTDLGDLAGFMAGNFEDNLSKLKTMSLEEPIRNLVNTKQSVQAGNFNSRAAN